MEAISCRFVILGSGCSNALPNLRHVLQPEGGCAVCRDALENPLSRNRRGNPSLLVSVARQGGSREHVLVDCGMTFQQGAQRFFPQLGVRGLAAVLLTHGHADAVLGLNCLREVQLAGEPADSWAVTSQLPIYATRDTADVVHATFGYIFPGGGDGKRQVGNFAIVDIGGLEPFCPVPGLRVQPLRVYHGGSYECLGFAFGAANEFVYLSDVSKVPPDTMALVQENRIQVLIIDALLKSKSIPPHFGLEEALDLVRTLRPARALLIGMSCEFDHDRDDAELQALAREGLDVRLSYDGMVLELDLVPAPFGGSADPARSGGGET